MHDIQANFRKHANRIIALEPWNNKNTCLELLTIVIWFNFQDTLFITFNKKIFIKVNEVRFSSCSGQLLFIVHFLSYKIKDNSSID